MASAHSVLEVCMHIIEKFTGGAGEHLIDQVPLQVKDLESLTTCSVFARGDSNDQIYEEYENPSTVDMSVWKKKRPPFYKSVLQCAFVVFRVILVVGSLCGVIGLVTIYILLNTAYHCEWIEMTDPSLQLTTKRTREITGLIVVSLLDHWLVCIWITVFTRNAIIKSRVFVVNTIYVLADISYRFVLQILNLYHTPLIPLPANIIYALAGFLQSYFLGKILFPRRKMAAFKVAARLSVPLIALITTTITFVYVVFPYFVSLHGITKLLVATVVPFCFLPTKLLSRFCVLGLQGVIHPGTTFALMSVIYAVFSALARAMQAELASMEMFVIYGVLHGIIHFLETLVISMMGHWWRRFRRGLFCRKKTSKVYRESLTAETGKRHKPKQHRSPYTQRLIADMSLQTMLHEAAAIILTTGVIQLYPFDNDTSLTPEQGAEILMKLLVCIFVALFTEFFFHSLSVLLQTRYLNIPVVRVWEAKWRLHLWVSASTTLMCIMYLTQYYLPIVRNKYMSEGAVFVNNTCTQPFV